MSFRLVFCIMCYLMMNRLLDIVMMSWLGSVWLSWLSVLGVMRFMMSIELMLMFIIV